MLRKTISCGTPNYYVISKPKHWNTRLGYGQEKNIKEGRRISHHHNHHHWREEGRFSSITTHTHCNILKSKACLWDVLKGGPDEHCIDRVPSQRPVSVYWHLKIITILKMLNSSSSKCIIIIILMHHHQRHYRRIAQSIFIDYFAWPKTMSNYGANE